MTTLYRLPELPFILRCERNDLVEKLLEIIHIHQLNDKILKEENERLKGKIAELEHAPKKPQIKPSTIEKPHSNFKKPKNREIKGSKKDRIPIHSELIVKPKEIPSGASFKGYRNYIVQDLAIKSFNTLFKIERWKTKEGTYLRGDLPPEYQGSHFGPNLQAFILQQHYQARVTQPILHNQLKAWGIEISAGQLNHMLSSHTEKLQKEMDEAEDAGIKLSTFIQTDDTGARHAGKNFVCMHIGNQFFTRFVTCKSKSRLSFLENLNRQQGYIMNKDSMDYLRQHGTLKQVQLAEKIRDQELKEEQLQKYLNQAGISSNPSFKEAAILGSLSKKLGKEYTVLSDGAAQYNVLNHASCWVHAIRLLEKEKPLKNEKVDQILKKLRFLYHHLKRYKIKPTELFKKRLRDYFDLICDLRVGSNHFQEALKRFSKNKEDLLRVLEKPEIPLHNNGSENDIREYVIRRKISYGTRSDLGRRTRDLFLSLAKTCSKLGISFWEFLTSRISFKGSIPRLANIIAANS
jgi:hypothetical protein